MRNLKKFLALVLAMMMAFSLMLTVSAAEVKPSTGFSDKDGITEAFVEAVDVLGGMKVYKGDENGFRPGDTITRAEVAALIYRLATGDVDDVRAGLYANYPVGGFTDVQESDWFAGYVGYCANAGYIKGKSVTTFDPYAPVTGYETLAMILRVIGYDKNHEFEGVAWQTNVSALGTQLGCLDDVKTTDYANTLHLASRRDVVASILFNAAAYVPTVTYTPMAGYNPYTALVSTDPNDTLGEKQFGLTYGQGIILGNQETGESNTKWGTTMSTTGGFIDNSKPSYTPTAAEGDSTHAISLKMDTGLAEFGHNFKVWYDHRGVVSSPKTVYTAYDKVVKTKLVTTMGNDGISLANVDRGDRVNVGSLRSVVTYNNEFTTTGEAYFSNAFKSFAKDSKFDATANSGWQSPVNLYVVVSNSFNNNVDAVISLNVQASKIFQSDNVTATKTITARYANPVDGGYGNPNENLGPDFEGTNNGAVVADGVDGNSPITILQSALTANSTNTLGDYVVINAIGTQQNSNASRQVSGYNVAKIVDTKVGQVASYNTKTQVASFGSGYNSLIQANWNPDYVMLTDGTKIEKSLLYYTVEQNTTGGYNTSIPQTQTGVRQSNADVYHAGSYKFYLDSEGRYIGAEPVYDAKFVYGTYLDYATATGSSTYEYTFVGVDMEGNQVVEKVKTIDGKPITLQTDVKATSHTHSIPYRDTAGAGQSKVTPGSYGGYVLRSDGALYTDTTKLDVPMYRGSLDPMDSSVGGGAFGGSIDIEAADIVVGAEETVCTNTFLTESTKFIVVSGTGTDTQKVAVYNGISELKGNASKVTINGNYATAKGVLDNDARRLMTYFSYSPFTYAQNNARQWQLDTVILPKDAITWDGTSDIYFVGGINPILIDTADATGNTKLYTMYVDGEARNVWLKSAVLAKNEFYHLKGTGTFAYDGEPVYQLDGAALNKDGTTDGVSAQETYKAASANSQTASISANYTALVNVANAKVVNLNPTAYPGIVDLATLNQASSLDTNYGISVSVVLKGKGATNTDALIVTTIYVNVPMP